MKQKSPSNDRAFIERVLVFLECRGREIRTPDLLLPKQLINLLFQVLPSPLVASHVAYRTVLLSENNRPWK